ncbi:MBL fold metallo-hydrolase [Janibacter hoylei]|uniref:MBL fold metallo-hydrolase n=1 Tax=Janibacter hoylei PVAS-1 TaxID=1210046 RepID=K1DVG2_9MICO|nr:MBL fold metallo-hydrolase [Janibacter hoylei]EKA60399.1 Zn-dependent hydrolase of beta-lactamase fold protein [Janibacter hoylei PVAS-1]RWU84234.1 MBL fold metallo-hydrolase [Janibacter hoylei PVAS-1]
MATATLEFIGTATSLVRLGEFTLLTDPNFLHHGQRAYLGKGLFSKRVTEPALGPEDLPSLDAVVLSHLHGDHFDRIARRSLDTSLPVLTTPHAARRLQSWGFAGAEAMATWQSRELVKAGETLTVHSAPGEHTPGWASWLLPPVMGSVLEHHVAGAARSLRVYITGDTLYRPWLREVTDRFGPLDAMVIHLGGTRALGLLVTMDAEQGISLVDLLEPAVTVPVHYDDYTVFRSPLSDFVARWRAVDPPGELRLVERGATVSLAP